MRSRPAYRPLNNVWDQIIPWYMEQDEEAGCYALALLMWGLGEVENPVAISFIRTMYLFWGLDWHQCLEANSLKHASRLWEG